MNSELEILTLSDYYEKFEKDGCEAYLIINNNMKDYKAMFGFVKLADNKEAAKEVFFALEEKAKELGFKHLVGPINYNTWMSYRFAISNYELKLYPDCNNPPYYIDIIKGLGYKELYTYRSASIDMNNPMFELGESIYREKLAEGYSFKTFQEKDALKVAKPVYEISKDAFADAYLYSDIPYEIFEKLYLFWVRQLKFSIIIAYKGTEAIGYVFGYENPVGEGFISKTSAVIKRYQKHKIYTALLYLGWKLVLNKGYKDMIYHFQCEQKDTFKRFEKKIESNEKRYAVYVKELV